MFQKKTELLLDTKEVYPGIVKLLEEADTEVSLVEKNFSIGWVNNFAITIQMFGEDKFHISQTFQ